MRLFLLALILLSFSFSFSSYAGCEICEDGTACCTTYCCRNREQSPKKPKNCSQRSVFQCEYEAEGSYCRTDKNAHGLCSIVSDVANYCACIPEKLR